MALFIGIGSAFRVRVAEPAVSASLYKSPSIRLRRRSRSSRRERERHAGDATRDNLHIHAPARTGASPSFRCPETGKQTWCKTEHGRDQPQ